MIQLILNGDNLLIVVHAVTHHLSQRRQQGIDLRHLHLKGKRTDNLQRIVKKMRINLRLKCSQLIGFIG
ncbi:hypothetical protein D3C74_449790 [compost metagenome]